MRRESNALIEIRVADETIRATPEHPFWVNGQWKQAGELEQGDELLRSDGFKTPILTIEHQTEKPTQGTVIKVKDLGIIIFIVVLYFYICPTEKKASGDISQEVYLVLCSPIFLSDSTEKRGLGSFSKKCFS